MKRKSFSGLRLCSIVLLAGILTGLPTPAGAQVITERVSVDSSGVEGNDGSFGPSFSTDGRFVAFQSEADNLVPFDTNVAMDIFVRDRQTGVTGRVSLRSGRVVEGNNYSAGASISADGRYVAYISTANNLVPGDTNGKFDGFVRLAQSIGLSVFGTNNYDQDPEEDIGIFRPSTGYWYIRGVGKVRYGIQWGDSPVTRGGN